MTSNSKPEIVRGTGKIDVHQHCIPPFFAEELRNAHYSEHRIPEWSPEAAIAFMDSQNIDKGVLSLSAPGVLPFTGEYRQKMARRVNEYIAAVAKEWKPRFGNFATLPLPDVEGALKEIEYALDILGADGVIVFTSYGDLYLGNPMFEPIWAELNKRNAIVFIHPETISLPILPNLPTPGIIDFPFATTRTAVDMVLQGVLNRYSSLRIILSHAGGFLPYAAERFAITAGTLPKTPSADSLLDAVRRFYFDTAMSTGPTTMHCLKAFAHPTHIVFGTDFPYAAGLAVQFTETLDCSDLSDGEHTAVVHDNAAAILSQER